MQKVTLPARFSTLGGRPARKYSTLPRGTKQPAEVTTTSLEHDYQQDHREQGVVVLLSCRHHPNSTTRVQDGEKILLSPSMLLLPVASSVVE